MGSTALTNLFGIAGVPAYYQPVKTVVRYELLGGRGNPWELPEAEVVFAKEMTGPCVYCEALFNPIRCLMPGRDERSSFARDTSTVASEEYDRLAPVVRCRT